MGKLYIVSTPIGNLEDISLRALRVLKEVDMIFAEDTRSSGKLLQRYNIKAPRLSPFFEGNEERQTAKVIGYLGRGKDIALISECGTPLISDPGFKLVREVVRSGMQVEAIPGPTALITALTVSGFPTNSFLFLGYLPKKKTRVAKLLKQVKKGVGSIDTLKTIIFYESPHRLIKTLQLIEEVFDNPYIVVARELTKKHEEVCKDRCSKVVSYFGKNRPRGELTVLFSLNLK